MSRFIIPTRLLSRRTLLTISSSPLPQRTSNILPGIRLARSYAVQAPPNLDEAELKIFNMLQAGLAPTKLEVQDVSGGCGSMYAIDIVSERFAGLTTIKQQRIVNQLLGEEIKKWHGMRLKTKAPGPEDD